MRIGIITIIDNLNYGNRLQNVALDMILKELGHTSTTGIICFCKEDWIIKTESGFKRAVKRFFPFFLYKKHIQHSLDKINKDDLTIKKREKFLDFNKEYLDMFPPVIARNNKQIGKILGESNYDFFISGSDQVWNPHFEGHTYEFLWFTDKQKRLSFAASIGVEVIPHYLTSYYKKSLQDYKWISVREESARKLLSAFSNHQIDVTLDPTMLVEREKWIDISRKPSCELPEKYMCAYFLGKTPDSVDEFSRRKGLPIVVLNNKNYPDLFMLDPAEFLYVINHSEFVLTDSFHAFVFSLKFNKEFYVFKRQQAGVGDMFSRIEGLINLFRLQNRVQKNDTVIEDELIDAKTWKEIGEYFASEKKQSINKLKEILNDCSFSNG